ARRAGPGRQLAVRARRPVLRRPVRRPVAGAPLLVAGDRGAVLLALPPRHRRGAGPRSGSLRVYAAVLAALVAVAAAATAVHGVDGWSTAYYATYVRMAEVLLGALLAVAATAGALHRPAVARAAAVAGVPALAVTAWAWWAVDHRSPALARGGLLAYAVASTALVAGASVPGPVRRALSWAPLRLLGVVSYGVYLVHWPIFLVLDADRTGLGRAPLFALR